MAKLILLTGDIRQEFPLGAVNTASQAAIAVQNARLTRKLQEQTRPLDR